MGRKRKTKIAEKFGWKDLRKTTNKFEEKCYKPNPNCPDEMKKLVFKIGERKRLEGEE